MCDVVAFILGIAIMMVLFIQVVEHSEISYRDKGKKYEYTVYILLVNSQKYEIKLYTNLLYTSIEKILRDSKIVDDSGAGLSFANAGKRIEVSKDKILLMEMQTVQIREKRESIPLKSNLLPLWERARGK